MTRRLTLGLIAALLAGGCEMAAVTPAPSFAPLPSSSTPASSASAAAPSALDLPAEISAWCRRHVEDVYAVTEGLGIPSDPRPFRLPPADDRGWAPVEGSRNYQVGCTAAWEERASAAP